MYSDWRDELELSKLVLENIALIGGLIAVLFYIPRWRERLSEARYKSVSEIADGIFAMMVAARNRVLPFPSENDRNIALVAANERIRANFVPAIARGTAVLDKEFMLHVCSFLQAFDKFVMDSASQTRPNQAAEERLLNTYRGQPTSKKGEFDVKDSLKDLYRICFDDVCRQLQAKYWPWSAPNTDRGGAAFSIGEDLDVILGAVPDRCATSQN